MVSSFTESRCAESAVAATAAAAVPTSSWPRLRCWLRGAAARRGQAMGISRDNWHKRHKTRGKRKSYHKKRKYEQ
ncbi:hypothetical protein QTO34_017365 [Cnephaeus nilssonii]|uniref:Uncharacterized protein n=1 Tax=Cnephaeus nilssonii TaxID=3371016 RepID=A0AA40LPQ7_CNENI|nr:hypothetical protein QTO34_017365 [Eptesicus nilssonii]